MRTTWWCDRCHASGTIRHKHDADIWNVNELLYVAHNDSIEAARERCDYSSVKVHVRANFEKKRPSPDPEP